MVLIHMLVGIPGSGKSTYALTLSKTLGIPIVSSDAVRNENPNARENEVWPLIYQKCIDYCLNNQDFIFDATNITPKVRKRFFDKISEKVTEFSVGAYYIVADADVCHARCIERNNKPGERYIPPEIIYDYAKEVIEPSIDEGFKFVKVIK